MNSPEVQVRLNEWDHLESKYLRIFLDEIAKNEIRYDPSHDHLHLKRVALWAKRIASQEFDADLPTVFAAIYLHDLIQIEKNDPRRSQASRISAQAAIDFLSRIEFQELKPERVRHAIEAHSFSSGIKAETIEARIVQDADRLDGLGMIGLMRMFSVTGRLDRTLYHSEDPFWKDREPDDRKYGLDHLGVKLIPMTETMQTETGQIEARLRLLRMQSFLSELSRELDPFTENGL